MRSCRKLISTQDNELWSTTSKITMLIMKIAKQAIKNPLLKSATTPKSSNHLTTKRIEESCMKLPKGDLRMSKTVS